MVKLSVIALQAGVNKAIFSHLSGCSCSSGWRCPPPRSARGVPRTSTRRSYLPCPSLLNVREYPRVRRRNSMWWPNAYLAFSGHGKKTDSSSPFIRRDLASRGRDDVDDATETCRRCDDARAYTRTHQHAHPRGGHAHANARNVRVITPVDTNEPTASDWRSNVEGTCSALCSAPLRCSSMDTAMVPVVVVV